MLLLVWPDPCGWRGGPTCTPLVQVLLGQVSLEPLAVLGFEHLPDVLGLRTWWFHHPMVWALPQEELEVQQLIVLLHPTDLGLTMEMGLGGHCVAAGHRPESCILLSLEISPASVAQHWRPEGCCMVGD